MSEENDKKTAQKIKKVYSRIIVVAGTLMGFVLCIYLFTLGLVIDGGYTIVLGFEIVTAVMFAFGLIYLKPVSLFLTRVLLSRNADTHLMLRNMTVADIEKIPQ